jgi:hypothetical protein
MSAFDPKLTSQPHARAAKGYIESFYGRMHDELLNECLFLDLVRLAGSLLLGRRPKQPRGRIPRSPKDPSALCRYTNRIEKAHHRPRL